MGGFLSHVFPSSLVLAIAAAMIGPLSGLITTRVMDTLTRLSTTLDKAPDTVKQIVVMFLAAVIPLANAAWGLQLPADYHALLAQPSVQAVVAMVLAFILKGHQQTKAVAAAVEAGPTPTGRSATT